MELMNYAHILNTFFDISVCFYIGEQSDEERCFPVSYVALFQGYLMRSQLSDYDCSSRYANFLENSYQSNRCSVNGAKMNAEKGSVGDLFMRKGFGKRKFCNLVLVVAVQLDEYKWGVAT